MGAIPSGLPFGGEGIPRGVPIVGDHQVLGHIACSEGVFTAALAESLKPDKRLIALGPDGE